MDNENEVFPGDEVAVEEEYMASEGTFAKNGIVHASQIGTLILDDEECLAKVISFNPPNLIKPGDIVYATVNEIKKTMATADVMCKEGSERRIGNETYATIHVSKISRNYTDNISKELRKGDLIRAKVTKIKPSLQLTTEDDHFGVIRSLCGKCKTKMIRKGVDALYCPKCKRTMPRKLANDYGDVSYE